MRKSDKKMDNQLRLLLTHVCEQGLKEIAGFEWLTHTVNYNSFPQSLRVTCVFDNNDSLEYYLRSDSKHLLISMITDEFSKLGLKLNNVKGHVYYDTEENCEIQHQCNWARRLEL